MKDFCFKNFRPSQCKPHPKVVELYYTGCSVGKFDHINKNCCKVRVQSSEHSESDWATLDSTNWSTPFYFLYAILVKVNLTGFAF